MLRPADHLSHLSSLLVVYGGGGLLLVLALWALVRSLGYRRQARLAEAAFDPDAPLVPGEMTMLGIVEYPTDSHGQHAVRVEVEQEGTEHESSGNWSQVWVETRRRVLVQPFYLRHASGRRVRVEPTQEVFLVDDMDGVIRVDLARRIRVAELTAGEQVYAHGRLVHGLDPEAEGGPYRGTHQGLVLRPLSATRPLLLSTRLLGDRFRRWARYHGRAARLLAVAVLVSQAIWLPYHLRVWTGETALARVRGTDHYTTMDDDGDKIDHYRVHLMLPTGQALENEVRDVVFQQLGTGQQVPVRLVRIVPRWSCIGSSATVDSFAAVLLGVVLVVSVVSYFGGARFLPAWYEAHMVEQEDGRLKAGLDHHTRPGEGGTPSPGAS